MVFTYFSPDWFSGIDIILEFSFFIISFIISLFSYKIYKQTSNRNVKYFGIGFLFISISYLIQTIFNIIILLHLKFSPEQTMITMMNYSQINNLESFGLLSHMIFMTLGLSFLTYTTFKEKNIKSLILIIILSIFGILLNKNNLYIFYLFSTIFLGFILQHFIKNYFKNKKIETLIVTIAFSFLFFASFHFLIGVDHELFYAIGHILEFFAYILILINLIIIRKK